jgi:hypothetical protein
MTVNTTVNPYTVELLQYSAERDYCISRPETWTARPPLVVDTPLHTEMVALADELWSGPSELVWYFLVGGPGNGKSEGVGAFVRRINANARAAGKRPVFEAGKGQGGSSIEYEFDAALPKGRMWLIQDVSVPRSSGSDPAKDLLAALGLCVNPGAHLLACANRGMLLRAMRIARKEENYKWLVRVLEAVDEQSRESAKAETAIFREDLKGKQVEIRVWPLDHESVLYGQGEGNPWAEPAGSVLDQILAKAAGEENWEQKACTNCACRSVCPMLGDAIWLRNDARRHSMLKVLRTAEVLSGQRIVLREALGLVSMVLVGSPSDFVDAGGFAHPCEWVHKRVSPASRKPRDTRALLDLLSHRAYQDVFGRPTPTALALDVVHQQRDGWLPEALRVLGPVGKTVADALLDVDKGFAKQTGPLRLVGPHGVLPPLDPAMDSAWCAQHSISTDGQAAELCQIGATHQGELEKELGDLVAALENAAKALPPHEDPAKAFAAIYRWASAIYVRLVGLALGETPLSESVGNYLALLEQPNRPFAAKGKQLTLRDLVKSTSSGQEVELAPGFTADIPTLQPVPLGARPRSMQPRWPANDCLGLNVSAGALGPPLAVQLSANIFVDTWRKQVLGLADWNIPPAIETLMHAWRDDFVVTKRQFRSISSLRFSGKERLEFEFIGPDEMLLRRR